MNDPISAQKNDDNDIFEKETKLVFDDNQVANEVLKTSRDKCSICKIGDLKPEGKPTPMVPRNGGMVPRSTPTSTPGAGSGQALGTGRWYAGPATVWATKTIRVSGYTRMML